MIKSNLLSIAAQVFFVSGVLFSSAFAEAEYKVGEITNFGTYAKTPLECINILARDIVKRQMGFPEIQAIDFKEARPGSIGVFSAHNEAGVRFTLFLHFESFG